MKIKPLGKVVILILVLGAVIGGYRMWKGPDAFAGLVPGAKVRPSVDVGKIDLPEKPDTYVPDNVRNMNMPSDEKASVGGPNVRMLIWAWNSQMGLMFANGGPQTTAGSLMEKRGVNLTLTRQDDAAKMQEALVAFATELSQGNPNPSKGAHFVAIMGDGAAAFLAGLNSTLERLGSEYRAKIVGSCGYSVGEDKFMGPQGWKDNPQLSKGGVVSGYLRDGDWNIAQKWLGDNGLKNNPDEKTWDPDALNWVAANDYIDAAEKYIAGYSETRPVVRNGKRTGEMKKITVQAVVTWTPGDVTVAEKKGGIVSIVSTKEYSTQMPNVIIGIDKWMRTNRNTVEGFLHAIMEGGDAVKASPGALRKAAEVSTVVYNEQGADAEYWEKYYKGTRERDKTGLMVDLGGSQVNNLADNQILFGMVPGAANLFAATYRVFGDVVVRQYPDLVPSYPAVDQILDTSYLRGIVAKAGSDKVAIREATSSVAPTTTSSSSSRVISQRSWNIQFETGKSTFTASAKNTLATLLRDLLIASGATIEIQGHTDSKGDFNKNMQLSEDRAFAVKKWLQAQSKVNFPDGRIAVVAYGSTRPAASNSSPEGMAKNRRVVIVLKAAK